MLYAVISVETGVIRQLSESREQCYSCMDFYATIGHQCVTVQIPQIELDKFGAHLLEIALEEATHDEIV